MPGSLLEPPEHVLSTLNRDGSRRWIEPRVSPGRFWHARRGVAYLLMAVFFLIPYLKINDKPAILLDIAAREFTILGKTFLPTDTLLLALLVVSVFLTVLLVTALFGRVWCGWACPQTVYMEFLFRPIERLFEGRPGGARKPARTPLRRALKFAAFLLLALFLAHTFLAYFVGVEALAQWVRRSPAEHPTSFVVMAVTTGLILFNFGYFREYTCIIACPYGRFQSVMLDRDSLIITYDRLRGEPRGRLGKGVALALPVVDGGAGATPKSPGDCVDCGLCVATCPTGIDIRNGLQLECIGCAQCIDACDAVMTKLKRPRGLIRYSSQNAVEHKARHLVRPRVIAYPAVLAVLLTVFGYTLANAPDADVTILRNRGMPFTLLDSGEVVNNLKVRVANRTEAEKAYAIEVLEPAGARAVVAEDDRAVRPHETRTFSLAVYTPRSAFVAGHARASIRVADGTGFAIESTYGLLGPHGPTPTEPTEDHDGD
ncbi:MAG: cytochrome c oxidase accessory protein CcoG [Phycisphaeraceae bacterium]|nr:MAG: cytochrome c oxidase accessory protein CcoG [Phycisphaeraceae bacterium]